MADAEECPLWAIFLPFRIFIEFCPSPRGAIFFSWGFFDFSPRDVTFG